MTISSSLPRTLQAFDWNRVWRIGLSIAEWTIGSCAAAEVAGYWLLRLRHSGPIRFFSRNDTIHHLVRNRPRQLQRFNTSRDAADGSMWLGNVGLEWLIPAGLLMAIIVAVFHLRRLLSYYQALSLGITLGWTFLCSATCATRCRRGSSLL